MTAPRSRPPSPSRPARFGFWSRWLLAASVAFTLMGVAIALFPDAPFLAPHTAATAEAFFGGTMPEEAEALRAFLFGPLGGTIAGYFLLQTFVVWGPFRRREPWAWHAVLWPLLLWFVLDSAASLYHGAAFNVWLVNVWTLLLVGLPLAMTRRAFRTAPAAPPGS